MSNNYLLPCDCGNSIPIETSQAGQEVTCKCGRRLTIPSLRSIRQLQPSTGKPGTKPTSQAESWNPAKGIMFALGAAMILGGLVTAAYSYAIYAQVATFQPSTTEYDSSLEAIEEMSPGDLYETWKVVREHGLEEAGTSPFAIARQVASEKLQLIYAGLIVAAVGFLIAVVPVFIPGK